MKRPHILIWESLHGPLPKGSVVHHIDENHENNNPENLQCLTRSEHASIHFAGKPNPGRRGITAWNKGKKMSDEARKHMSDAHSGKPGHKISREQILAMAAGRRGKPRGSPSRETILAMAAGRRGKPQSAEHIAKRVATTKARRKAKEYPP